MSDNLDSLDTLVAVGGAGGLHTVHPSVVIPVAPATADEFNTVRQELTPAGCVLLKDSRFEFDSSFVSPRAIVQMKFLGKLRAEGPGLVASVFGHADPVGDDSYNKKLSGRRAQAIYGLLTRKPELWEDLFSSPIGNDKWGDSAIQVMLSAVGQEFEQGSETSGESMTEAVKSFQGSAGLSQDGKPGPATRKELFRAYMDAICVGPSGQPFQLDPKEDFLARGVDKGGKGDYQGCSEFNPVLVFSKVQTQEFDNETDMTAGNKANQPNRRVMIFLFREGHHVLPEEWPCPRVKEDVGDCRKRFFSDAGSRLANGEAQREYRLTKDTFACRFYDRFARESPCETGPETGLKCHLSLLLRSNSGCVPLSKRKYKISITPDRTIESNTDENGLVQHSDIPPGDYKLEIEGHTTFVPATPVFREPSEHQVDGFFLFQDNDMPPSPAPGLDDDLHPPPVVAEGKPLEEANETTA